MEDFSVHFSRKRKIKHIIIGIILIAVIIVVTLRFTTTFLQLDSKTFVSFQLPRSFHNIKIVYASDFLYNGGNAFFMNETIHKINSARADIVILGGNYGTTPENTLAFFDLIPNIHARIAVFAVVGSNDIDKENRDFFLLNQKLKSRNIQLLVNQAHSIKQNDEKIIIYGIDDYENGQPSFQNILEASTAEDFVIFASHSHEALRALTGENEAIARFADLALMGSTLGGQYLWVEPFRKSIDPVHSPIMFRGWRSEKRNQILVSQGVGTYGGFRFAIRPQIHEIVFKYK